MPSISIFSEPASSILMPLDSVLLPKKCFPQPVYISMPVFLWILFETHFSSSHLIHLNTHIEVAVGILYITFDMTLQCVCFSERPVTQVLLWTAFLFQKPTKYLRNCQALVLAIVLSLAHCVKLTNNPLLHHFCHIYKPFSCVEYFYFNLNKI